MPFKNSGVDKPNGNPTDYRLDTTCENCGMALAEHKGWYCVTGPKHFRTIATTSYKGDLIPK